MPNQTTNPAQQYLLERYRQALKRKLSTLPPEQPVAEQKRVLRQFLADLVAYDQASLQQSVLQRSFALQRKKLSLIEEVLQSADSRKIDSLLTSLQA